MKRLVLTILMTACATATATAPRAPTVTRVGHETQICLDRAPVRVGETLRFHRHVCEYVAPKNLIRRCHDEPIASAEVVRVVDEQCVIVSAPAPTRLQPGDELELVSR